MMLGTFESFYSLEFRKQLEDANKPGINCVFAYVY